MRLNPTERLEKAWNERSNVSRASVVPLLVRMGADIAVPEGHAQAHYGINVLERQEGSISTGRAEFGWSIVQEVRPVRECSYNSSFSNQSYSDSNSFFNRSTSISLPIVRTIGSRSWENASKVIKNHPIASGKVLSIPRRDGSSVVRQFFPRETTKVGPMGFNSPVVQFSSEKMGVDVFTFLYENLRVERFKKSYLGKEQNDSIGVNTVSLELAISICKYVSKWRDAFGWRSVYSAPLVPFIILGTFSSL